MWQIKNCNWSFLFLLSTILVMQVQCLNNSDVLDSNRRNGTYISEEYSEEEKEEVGDLTKALTNIFTEARKGGGGGGGGLGLGGAIMKTVMSMCSTTIPMVTMHVMGWMKDIMMMGAGAFMMMMYDMLRKSGDQKKIIIKLPPQAAPPPEPVPPAQTGYGPWEGR